MTQQGYESMYMDLQSLQSQPLTLCDLSNFRDVQPELNFSKQQACLDVHCSKKGRGIHVEGGMTSIFSSNP